MPFYVDERVIVPRSLIGELLMTAFAEDNALTGDPRRIASVLDLCAGGGSLAILAARVFPNARVEAVDCSAGALDVAKRNVEEHGLSDRIALKEGDLFAPVKDGPLRPDPGQSALCRRGDDRGISARIRGRTTNSPCRRRRRARYRAPDPERSAGASGGRAGCSSAKSAADGTLLERDFPHLPFVWLDTEETSGEVFLLRASDLAESDAARSESAVTQRR